MRRSRRRRPPWLEKRPDPLRIRQRRRIVDDHAEIRAEPLARSAPARRRAFLPARAGEEGPAEARYHGVAEEDVPFRDIAGVIGRRRGARLVAKTREEAADHFGWFAHFAALDTSSSSTFTQRSLGWRPVEPALLPDLDRPRYFES
jgi:hypothetical protein